MVRNRKIILLRITYAIMCIYGIASRIHCERVHWSYDFVFPDAHCRTISENKCNVSLGNQTH